MASRGLTVCDRSAQVPYIRGRRCEEYLLPQADAVVDPAPGGL